MLNVEDHNDGCSGFSSPFVSLTHQINHGRVVETFSISSLVYIFTSRPEDDDKPTKHIEQKALVKILAYERRK